MAEPEGPQVIWRIGVACWISKATRTHAHKYVILTAFLQPGSLPFGCASDDNVYGAAKKFKL